jgi:diguanylate cyclase (GGDEF)-like protein
VRDVDGRALHLLGQLQDITERKRYEERLQHMADHDPLTGLLNRRSFERALSRHAAGIRRYGATGALLVLDLDGFKHVNDEHGHAAGDQVLRLIGSTLTRTEGGGRPFRYGGEEFAVLFSGKSADEALPYIEDLRETIEASTFIVRARNRPRRRPAEPGRASGGQRRVAITVSIGVAEPQDSGADPEDVIRTADQALYRAKRAGRNRVVVAD